MKNLKYYILMIMTALLASACSDDLEQEPQDVDFCMRAAWQNGRSGDNNATRALTATDILADGTEDIVIDYADYPATIDVSCSDGQKFTLTKGSVLCDDHEDYWQYTPSIIYKDKKIERDNLTFTFSATIDEGDELEGEANKESITEKTSSGQRHMLVTLHHTKALLRFGFKVSEKYDKVRYIVVKGVKINGDDCTTVPKVINTTTLRAVSYMYISPSAVDANITSTPMQIECTYDIYEKDAVFTNNVVTDDDITKNADHLTRKDVVAKNTFTLNNIKDADKKLVTQLKAGYYYDLNITLNPDYLYVLSEHDNKHMTIE